MRPVTLDSWADDGYPARARTRRRSNEEHEVTHDPHTRADDQRRPYAAPRLTRLGSLAELTLGDFGGIEDAPSFSGNLQESDLGGG